MGRVPSFEDVDMIVRHAVLHSQGVYVENIKKLNGDDEQGDMGVSFGSLWPVKGVDMEHAVRAYCGLEAVGKRVDVARNEKGETIATLVLRSDDVAAQPVR